MCVPWIIHVCAIADAYVLRLIHMFALTHSDVLYHAFIVCHDSFVCMP